MQKKITTSPTIAVLLAAGIEPTLDKWLAFNEATDTFDAELLEILPVEFHEEYIDRLRLHNEYEAKFTAVQSAKTTARKADAVVPVGVT